MAPERHRNPPEMVPEVVRKHPKWNPKLAKIDAGSLFFAGLVFFFPEKRPPHLSVRDIILGGFGLRNRFRTTSFSGAVFGRRFSGFRHGFWASFGSFRPPFRRPWPARAPNRESRFYYSKSYVLEGSGPAFGHRNPCKSRAGSAVVFGAVFFWFRCHFGAAFGSHKSAKK